MTTCWSQDGPQFQSSYFHTLTPVSCVFLLKKKKFLEVPPEYFSSHTIYYHLELGHMSTLKPTADKGNVTCSSETH